MTHNEFTRIMGSINALSPELIPRQLRHELDNRLATAEKQAAGPPQGITWGDGDAADELDQIVEQAMRNRRERPWRLSPGE